MRRAILRGLLWAVVVAAVVLTPACEVSVTGPLMSPEVAAAIQVAVEMMR